MTGPPALPEKWLWRFWGTIQGNVDLNLGCCYERWKLLKSELLDVYVQAEFVSAIPCRHSLGRCSIMLALLY